MESDRNGGAAQDGTTVVDFNRRTFYSCVLFLNRSEWGPRLSTSSVSRREVGHTRLYADEQMARELQKDGLGRLTGALCGVSKRLAGDPELVVAEVEPRPGRMLVFYHRLMHEGVPAAEKYIIRTDVLYRRQPELCTAPDDVEAFRMYQAGARLGSKRPPGGAAAGRAGRLRGGRKALPGRLPPQRRSQGVGRSVQKARRCRRSTRCDAQERRGRTEMCWQDFGS